MSVWFRGGKSKKIPVWWSKSRDYAEFYEGELFRLEMQDTDRILDLADIGVDVDAEFLVDAGLPVPRTSSGEMYEWAEKSWRELQALGFAGVIVKQWHADFGDRAYTSLLLWESTG